MSFTIAKPENETLKKKYEKYLDKFLELLKKDMYKPFMVEEILKRIIQQKEDAHDENTQGVLNNEIDRIKEVANERNIDVSKYIKLNINDNVIKVSPSGAAVLQAPTAAAPPLPPVFDEMKKRFTKLLGKVKAKLLTLSAQATQKTTQTKKHTEKKSSSQKQTTNAKNKSSNGRASAQEQTASHKRRTNAKRKSTDSRSSVHIQSSSKNASQSSHSEKPKAQPAASNRPEQARTECPDTLDNQRSQPEKSGRFGTNKKELLKVKKSISKTPRKSTQTKNKQKNDPSLDD